MPLDLTKIKCDTCGTVNPIMSRKCLTCGEEFTGPNPTPRVPKCLKCGYQNADGARYCAKCNYILPTQRTAELLQDWSAPGADPMESIKTAFGIASGKIDAGDLLTAIRCDPHLENILKARAGASNMEPQMGSEASAMVHHDMAVAKARDDASKIVGVSLNNGVAGDLVKMSFAGVDFPRIPSLPQLPTPQLPRLPSLPTFNLPVNANPDGSRTVWVGLFRSDGQEVVAREYRRKPVKLFEGGSSENVKFDTAVSKWGIISEIGLFELQVSKKPLIRFPLAGGAKHVVLGTTVIVNNIVFEAAPSSKARPEWVTPAEDVFEASGEEKARLKDKMSKAMGAMSKLKKEGL